MRQPGGRQACPGTCGGRAPPVRAAVSVGSAGALPSSSLPARLPARPPAASPRRCRSARSSGSGCARSTGSTMTASWRSMPPTLGTGRMFSSIRQTTSATSPGPASSTWSRGGCAWPRGGQLAGWLAGWIDGWMDARGRGCPRRAGAGALDWQPPLLATGSWMGTLGSCGGGGGVGGGGALRRAWGLARARGHPWLGRGPPLAPGWLLLPCVALAAHVASNCPHHNYNRK